MCLYLTQESWCADKHSAWYDHRDYEKEAKALLHCCTVEHTKYHVGVETDRYGEMGEMKQSQERIGEENERQNGK